MVKKTLYIYTVKYSIKGAGKGLYSTQVPAYNATEAVSAARTLVGKAGKGFHAGKRKSV